MSDDINIRGDDLAFWWRLAAEGLELAKNVPASRIAWLLDWPLRRPILASCRYDLAPIAKADHGE
ncbi:MAG TPA: hypothetical protein VMT89_18265 [Candidatus Acidoferrales bacterium]|nr:hypothetical protein [Candidatus Acidoferrales bacterium]